MRNIIKIRKEILLFLFVFVTAFCFMYILYINEGIFSEKISYEALTNYVVNHQVDSLGYNKDTHRIVGQLNGQTPQGDSSFIATANSDEDFKKLTQSTGINIYDLSDKKYAIEQSLTISLVLALVIFFLIKINIRKKSAAETVGETIGGVVRNTKENKQEKEFTTFRDVAGCTEAKENLMELVDFLQNPDKYKKYGAKIPQGTILYGPPGTGKTLLAKALAGEAKSNFISAVGSDFVEKYVGVGAARVRGLFAEARKKTPCIIFIDEIDAVGSSRNSSENNDEKKHTLNQFLSEMDGFKDNTGIIVIAATNRFEDLDAAFIRSGRFDRQICVDLPDVSARYEILKVHSKNKPLKCDINLMEIARQTTFMSGADLENVMNEAAIYCAKEEGEAITFEHINKAINKVLVGDEKKNRENYKQKDKEITAYHEAGHAIISRMVAKDDVPKVSIIPTTKGAGGYTLTLPEESLYNTKKQLRQRISVMLAGRAAEEIIFGEENVTGGAANDIERATSLSFQIVTSLGMSKQIGLVNINYISKYSGDISEIIFKEVKAYMDEVYEETKQILNTNREKLISTAKLLLEKETIFKTDLDTIIYSEGDV